MKLAIPEPRKFLEPGYANGLREQLAHIEDISHTTLAILAYVWHGDDSD